MVLAIHYEWKKARWGCFKKKKAGRCPSEVGQSIYLMEEEGELDALWSIKSVKATVTAKDHFPRWLLHKSTMYFYDNSSASRGGQHKFLDLTF